MKLRIFFLLGIFPIYSMDGPLTMTCFDEDKKACRVSIASHLIEAEGHEIDAPSNMLQSKIASNRTINIQSCCKSQSGKKHCNKHSSNDILLFPDLTGYVEIFADAVEVNKVEYEEPQYLRMPHADSVLSRKENDHIQACALSGDGKVLAAVGGSFICLWRNDDHLHKPYYEQRENKDISRFIQKVVLVDHVALSDSGETVAVRAMLEKNEGFRILVFKSWGMEFLYNLPGSADRFFYMIAEDIIRDRLSRRCYQYDLRTGRSFWDSLKNQEKRFLSYIHQKYEETKQKVVLRKTDERFVIYQELIKVLLVRTWIDERVYVHAEGLFNRLWDLSYA